MNLHCSFTNAQASTCNVAAVCIERQHFDVFIVGAGGQQFPTVAPSDAVDGAFVVFVPPEAQHRLLDRTRTTAGTDTDRHRMV